VDNRSEARSRATERGPVFSGVLRPGHWRDHSRRRGFGVRVACLSLTALLLSTLAATLSGSPVAAQTATPISVPSDQGLSGSWVSPTGYAFVAFNEGTGLASRLVAIRPADGSELFSVDLPGVVWDVTFGADGGAFAAVNNNDGDDQGWVYKISPTGVIVERRDLAPYVLPNQIEFGADGRVYVTTWPDPGNGALLALNASSLATEAAVPLSEVGQLHARSSGLVLIVAGLVRFFGTPISAGRPPCRPILLASPFPPSRRRVPRIRCGSRTRWTVHVAAPVPCSMLRPTAPSDRFPPIRCSPTLAVMAAGWLIWRHCLAAVRRLSRWQDPCRVSSGSMRRGMSSCLLSAPSTHRLRPDSLTCGSMEQAS
jgi:hypothetical protein